MPSPYISDLSKQLGMSTNKIEKLWDKAKEITSDTFGVSEKDFGDREYAYIMGVVKNMLGIEENTFKYFLDSKENTDKFIETLVSGNFNIGKDGGIVAPNMKKVDVSDYTKSKEEPTESDIIEFEDLQNDKKEK